MFEVIILITIVIFSVGQAEKVECNYDKFYATLPSGVDLHIVNPSFELQYNRENVRVYRYLETQGVNIFIDSGKLNFKGDIINAADGEKIELSKKPELDGVDVSGYANIGENKEFLGCEFSIDSKTSTDYLEEVILTAASACVKDKLCKNLGFMKLEDVERAEEHPMNFGSMSIGSESLRRRAPGIDGFGTHAERHIANQKQVCESVDKMMEAMSTRFQTKHGNKFKIPHFLHKDYAAKDGELRNIKNINRDKYRIIGVEQNQNTKMLSFNFEIRHPQLVFQNYERKVWDILIFGLSKRDNSFIVNIDKLGYFGKISMTFASNDCKTSLAVLQPLADENMEICKDKECKSYSDESIKMDINARNEITKSIRKELAEYLINDFDCLEYRDANFH